MTIIERLRINATLGFLKNLVFVTYIFMLAPIWGTGVLCYLYVPLPSWVKGLIVLSILGLICAAWWFSRITGHYMVIENMSFKTAFQHTFYPVLLQLSFLPFIGDLFESILDSKKEDTVSDESE